MQPHTENIQHETAVAFHKVLEETSVVIIAHLEAIASHKTKWTRTILRNCIDNTYKNS